MLEWLNNLDPTVQAAIITGLFSTIVALITAGVNLSINKIKKGDNHSSENKTVKQKNRCDNAVQVGEQNQMGGGNTLNNYYNCSIQTTSPKEDKSEINAKFVQEQISRYMDEHTATDEDIDKLFVDAPHMISYLKQQKKDTFTFDYSNNNGEYTIGFGNFTFVTKWSKASDTSIHAYKDSLGANGAIARVKAPSSWPTTIESHFDFSSRVRTPNIGDIIIWRNSNSNYAATKIISIKDDTRGADHDELTCEYIIYSNVHSSNITKAEILNATGGHTVIIDDEKYIAERIVEEHDKEIERKLKEI